ncbi:MAG: cytochrome c [Acidobacteria bacterium]|nr:cytochrome c [Acidobacteriota bacterium]
MIRRVLLWFLAVAVLGIGGTVAFLSHRSPDMRTAPSIKVASTPERIARGELIFGTAGCADCHSETDPTRFGFPVKDGGLGKGKPIPELPGTIAAPNLTSDPETGAARFTDGQLIRAIREGIGYDDRVLFPMMPFTEYREMSDEDVQSVVAYIRTIPPIRNALPPSKVMFPVNLFIKSLPKVVESVPQPAHSGRGAYLAKVNGCYFCHTPTERDQPVPSKAFSGGHVFSLAKDVRVVSANLTPDRDTGLGTWTEPQFLAKFAEYKDYAANGPPKIGLEYNTVMPWLAHTRLPDDDLKAIFAHLRTLPAIANPVVVHPDAPEEKPRQ